MIDENRCFICGLPGRSDISGLPALLKINCNRCGQFEINDSFRKLYRTLNFSSKHKANISSWIRLNQAGILKKEHITIFKNLKSFTVAEKANNLLQFLANEYPEIGKEIKLSSSKKIYEQMKGIVGTFENNELEYIIQEYLAAEKGYINFLGLKPDYFMFSPKGWAHVEEVNKGQNSKVCFVAMSFSTKLKRIYLNAIKPAINMAGFQPMVMWERKHNNKIDDEIMTLIRQSRFLIADFTEQNQGAYYEAGFARGLGKTVISTCEKHELDNQQIHFDTRQYLTIPWEWGKLKEFKTLLTSHIKETIKL